MGTKRSAIDADANIIMQMVPKQGQRSHQGNRPMAQTEQRREAVDVDVATGVIQKIPVLAQARVWGTSKWRSLSLDVDDWSLLMPKASFEDHPRSTWKTADQGGRSRRIPPGATAKALPRPGQRDWRERDSHGVCDLMGAAQDAINTVEWNRLALEQEQAMKSDKNDGPRPRRASAKSASPLKRKIPLQRRNDPGRDLRLVSRERELSRRHGKSRSRRQSWSRR
eukprot:g31560.t1